MTVTATIDIVEAAWNEMAHPIKGRDPAVWRKDDNGALIQRDAYDDPDHPCGWTLVEVQAPDGSWGARVRHVNSKQGRAG